MWGMKRLVWSIICICSSIIINAQEDTLGLQTFIEDEEFIELIDTSICSSAANTDTIIFTNFNTNLDSLVNLWYVAQSKYWLYAKRTENFLDTAFEPEFTPDILKERIEAMNSLIPLTYNSQVQAFIRVYASRNREKVEVMLGLAEYYFPMFEEVLSIYDMPLELKYLAIIESALNPRATSPVGAGGLWQFMPSTGRMYKLYISSFIDDRRDPYKSTHAAAQYLQSLHGMFGDWLLALASYNCGPGNVRKAITRAGGKRNFWDIYPYLPRETRGYVPAFIAAYYVFEHAVDHNLFPRDIEFPSVTDTLMITKKLHLQQVADVLNVPLKALQDLNPHLRANIIPDSEQGYALYLPIEYVSPFLQFQDSIHAYKDSVFFNKEALHKVAASATNYYGGASTKNRTPVYYYVKSGDNLSLIASWYDVNVNALKQWNGLRTNNLRIGQKITVYVPHAKKDYYARITSMSYAQKQALKSSAAPQVATPTPAKSSSQSGNYTYHVVKQGESLWAISRQYENSTVEEILKLNGLTTKSTIHPGMKLKIKTL